MNEYYTHVYRSGKFLLVRGRTSEGKAFREKVAYKPSHYVPSDDIADCTSLDGKKLRKIDFSSMWEARDFIKKYDGLDNFSIYGFNRYEYNFIYEKYRNQKTDLSKIVVVYIDIECKSERGFPRPEVADQELTVISLRKGDLRITLGTVDYVEHVPNIVYIKCKDEKDLIYKFIDAWKKLDPDIVTGWNIEFFDIPYLYNRITNVLGETEAKSLSPWGLVREYTVKDKFGKEDLAYELVGITTLDLMVVYKKFSFKNQESYSLDYIASVELDAHKVDYTEYGNLTTFYKENPQKFVEYNIEDNDLVFRIAKKTGLLEQIMEMAYGALVNFSDVFGSVLFWEVIIKNFLMDSNIAVKTSGKRNHKIGSIVGAFVKEPIPKLYKWVIGLDLDSLYPHLIMQYNISPETLHSRMRSLIEELSIEDILDGRLSENELVQSKIKQNCGYTPNGMFFDNSIRGFLPKLMDKYYADRKHYKGLLEVARREYELANSTELEALITKYNNIQLAKKIALNSAYGALSNEWCSWYDLDLAEAITFSGQLAIKWVAKKLNESLNQMFGTYDIDYVIASDTDSAYLVMDKLVNKIFGKDEQDKTKIVKFLEKVCKQKINPLIKEIFDELTEITGAYENKMSMKVESISESGMWTKKKKYALLMWWDEGVLLSEPKVKIKGLKSVQSSTPKVCRDKIKKSVEYVLKEKKDELYSLVNDFEKNFLKMSFMEVASTITPSDIEKYADNKTVYGFKTPAHVRAALFYNKMIKENKLDRKYRKINNGDKIKWAYMKVPNPIGQNVFAVYDILPTEFKLEEYVDKTMQFNKEFIEPVNQLAKLAGWDIQNMNNLESFFV